MGEKQTPFGFGNAGTLTKSEVISHFTALDKRRSWGPRSVLARPRWTPADPSHTEAGAVSHTLSLKVAPKPQNTRPAGTPTS